MKLLLLLLAGLAQSAGAGPVWFAHVTDMHLGHQPGHANVGRVIDAIRAAPSPPAFVVFTGDNVEVGRPEHWAHLAPVVADRLASIPVYFTTGNHEVAWSGLEGKRLFRRYTGAELRYTREVGGILFVALDAAVHGQHSGHLGREQLDWLDGVLAGSAAPVKLVGLHHMVFREAGDRYLDDEAAFHGVLARRGVSLVLCGHGHGHDLWQYRGVPVVETGAAYQKGFSAIRVAGREISVVFHSFDQAGRLVAGEPVPIRDGGGVLAAGIKVMNEGDLPREAAPEVPAGVRLRWARTLGGEILGGPVPAAGCVYVTAGDAGLFCLDALTGATRWSVTLAGFAMAKPLPVGGMIVAGSENGVLAAFSASDGTPVWTVTAGGSIAAAPAVLGGTLIVGSGDGVVHAVSLTGAVVAETRTEGNISVQPAVFRGLACVTNWAGELVALDGAGRIAWSRSFPEMIYSGPGRNAPCVAGDTVVVATARPALIGYDAATGGLRWETEAKVAYSSPVPRGGEPAAVVFQTLPGDVCVVRASDGRRIASIPGGSPSYVERVAVSGARGYAASEDGRLRAVDLGAGRERWVARLGSGFLFGDPAASGRTVFAGTVGGELFALEDGQ